MATKTFNVSMATTIAKKMVMALTGLFLVIFVIEHMLGNLSFVFGGPDAFNMYAHKLVSFGPILYVIELVLLAAFLFHIWNGVMITRHNRQARPSRYYKLKSTGGPSKQTISSKTMIYTGLILLIFTVIHLKTFKYGLHYETVVDGIVMRDLYRLVQEKFLNPVYAFGYIAVMILLGYHLRHGFWSAFQSLGANNPKYSNKIYAIGIAIAIIVAFGFLVVPFKVYFSQFF